MKLNALWWWIDRWRKSTAYTDMTLEQQGAYRNLLDEQTLRDGPIPNDERILAKACGDALAWFRVRDAVLSRFELLECGWINHTCADVNAKGKDLREKRSSAGKLGNATRWGSKPIASGIAKPVAEPITNASSPVSVSVSGSPSPGKIVSLAPLPATAPAVLEFPVVGVGGNVWGLTQLQIDQWKSLFPTIDVLAECKKALAWVLADLKRRKTARGMLRFLTSWLTRATEGRPSRSVPVNGTAPGGRVVAGAEETEKLLAEYRQAGGRS